MGSKGELVHIVQRRRFQVGGFGGSNIAERSERRVIAVADSEVPEGAIITEEPVSDWAPTDDRGSE